MDKLYFLVDHFDENNINSYKELIHIILEIAFTSESHEKYELYRLLSKLDHEWRKPEDETCLLNVNTLLGFFIPERILKL